MMPTFAYEGVDRKGVKSRENFRLKTYFSQSNLTQTRVTVRTIREKRKNILEGLFKKKSPHSILRFLLDNWRP